VKGVLLAWSGKARTAALAYRERFKRERGLVLFEAAATLLLALSFFAFLRDWWHVYSPALTDPNLQTDDARTALFAFHRYASGHPLAHDPIANEMIEYQPYAFRFLYRLAVPLVGLLYAAKIAQAVCLALIVAGGVVLWRSPRAGLGAGALFVFVFLRDGFIMDRVGGGLPRSFGFPAMALWLAGALGHDRRARRAGAIAAALTYPSALAMVLGAEGLYALRRLGRPGFRTTLRRLKHYLALSGVCAALFLPTALFGASDGGPVHTLEQAEQEPAFGKSGRLWLLPLGETGVNFGKHLFRSFIAVGNSPVPPVQDAIYHRSNEAAGVFIALLLVLPLFGVVPTPAAVIAFLAASLTIYAASVVFAFQLYSPERYYSYGMHMVAVGLVVSTLGLLIPRLKLRLRVPLRNAASAAIIFALWSWLGNGAPTNSAMAMTIDYRRNAPLWEFIRSLPKDVRIASFISDGDDIPLFAQRANNGGFETMQPWLTLSWARQKARAEDTLRAFYATSHEEVLDYAKKYGVTHLLVNQVRYRSDFVRRARTFQPLSTFSDQLLGGRRLSDLVLAEPPEEAVIYRQGRFSLLDVKKLAEAWSKPAPARNPGSAEDPVAP
jgi:hypothetical protein